MTAWKAIRFAAELWIVAAGMWAIWRLAVVVFVLTRLVSRYGFNLAERVLEAAIVAAGLYALVLNIWVFA